SGSQEEPEKRSLANFREPRSIPIIQAVSTRDEDGQPTNRFYVGSGMTVVIDYDSPMPLTDPVFGIFVQGMTGERLIHLQSLAQYGPVEEIPRRGTIHCHVPCLPLMPGVYHLSFGCTQLHQQGRLDHLDRALSFNVESSDFFGTGRLPPRGHSSFLVRAQWKFPEPAESASPPESNGQL